MEPAPLLSYDVVMATRNRPEAVALSLPLLLAQSRSPARIVIVDSSDDGAPIEALAREADGVSGITVVYLRSASGSAFQRNLGLAEGRSDVVIFPDDDSLLYPDAAERMMEVYEADTGAQIAAVCARPAPVPPGGDLRLETVRAERMSGPRLAARRLRQGIKERLAPLNPFLAVGNRLNDRHVLPPWAAAMDVTPVPYMTGFRMSFRRAVIAQERFDEALLRYAWFEDIDASFRAMRHGAVVVAGRAGIHHHRVEGPRAGGTAMGLWAILNRGYVVMKSVDANPDLFPNRDRERRRLKLYCAARTAAYSVLARSSYSRDRARAARIGLARLDKLTAARGVDLARSYAELSEG